MEPHYLLLFGESARDAASTEASLLARGFRCELRTPHACLYVSTATPVLRWPGHGVLIGRLFDRNGKAITLPFGLDSNAEEREHQVLHDSWGEYLLVQLAGSAEDPILRLLRDPSGAVPCVYQVTGKGGFVTSDIALAAHLGLYHKTVDWAAMAHGLAYPYLRTGRTTLDQLRELLPGFVLHCDGTGSSTRMAWTPWRFVSSDRRHEDRDAAAADIRSAVSMVVCALTAADRKLVVELSGGLDSSIVAVCLREQAAAATFCTLVMPVAGTDERPYARLVTDALATELVTQQVGFQNVRFDFPLAPSAVLPAMGILQNAVNEAWEVAGAAHAADSYVSGGGGDTVFCYLKTAAPAADAFRENGLLAGITAIEDLSTLHQCTFWTALRLTLRKLARPGRDVWKQDRRFLAMEHVPEAPEHHGWLDMPVDALPGDREKIQDLIGTQLFRDTAPRRGGRSMHFPLLSQPVMEACLRVPSWMWINRGRNRAVARDAFSDRLPLAVRDRRSKGSYTGYMAAAYARNRQGMRRFLGEGQLAAHGLLDHAALMDFLDHELAPRDLSFLRVFDLCAAENWARQQV